MVSHTIAALSILAAAAVAGSADAQTLYRYIDANGRVAYSDQPPPPSAKDVQPRELTSNVIETDPVSFATRQAKERYPVTLYTFDCDVCRDAQAMLVKRGVPFQTVIVTEEKGAARLKALTGKQSAPVLQVGENQILQGYSEGQWNATLDDAGYPKSAPPPRSEANAESPATPPAPKATSTQPPATPETPAPTGRGHDYPK